MWWRTRFLRSSNDIRVSLTAEWQVVAHFSSRLGVGVLAEAPRRWRQIPITAGR
jgi:hypothetical protein